MEILRRIYEIIESVRNELVDRRIYKADYIVRKNLRRKNRVQLIRRPLMSRELYRYKSLHSTRAKKNRDHIKAGSKTQRTSAKSRRV